MTSPSPPPYDWITTPLCRRCDEAITLDQDCTYYGDGTWEHFACRAPKDSQQPSGGAS